MTGPAASPISALLHADPAFGAGASSFSSGLEALVRDGIVCNAKDLVTQMIDAVRLRWNTFDRVFLVRSHALPSDEHGDAVRADLDHQMEVSMPGASARAASRRAGTALLGTWTRLGRTPASRYREQARRRGGSHLPVAQGLVWADEGVSLFEAEALACWALLSASASSAVRLGAVGHRAAQSGLIDAVRALSPLLAVPVLADAVPHAFTPVQDIAMERHALADLTLFAS